MNAAPTNNLAVDEVTGRLKAGPGRPAGSYETANGVKRMLVELFEDVDSREKVKQALRDGLTAPAPKSFPYQQLAAHYLDGKPVERVEVVSRSVVIGIGQDQITASPWVKVIPALAEGESADSGSVLQSENIVSPPDTNT